MRLSEPCCREFTSEIGPVGLNHDVSDVGFGPKFDSGFSHSSTKGRIGVTRREMSRRVRTKSCFCLRKSPIRLSISRVLTNFQHSSVLL